MELLNEQLVFQVVGKRYTIQSILYGLVLEQLGRSSKIDGEPLL
jgi:hypothetical protein